MATRYRWVVLAVFMLLSMVVQIQWLTHAPIARAAQVYYAGQFDPESLVNIDFLALIYMLVYLVMSIPASYVIDTRGIRVGLGIGALVAGVCGLVKGLFAANFAIVLLCQVGLSVAQPFVVNALTALTVRWFPLKERAIAAGLGTLAMYVGIVIAMVVTPMLVDTSPDSPTYGAGIGDMLMIYGVATAIAAALSLASIRERPTVPVSDEQIERHGFGDGLRHILTQRDMVITIGLFFIGLGIFNAISAMVDSIAAMMGVQDSDGLIGGLMLFGGIIGAVVVPILSDKLRKRKLFLVICMIGMVPGVAGLAFAGSLAATPDGAYTIALIASFVLGFFVMSAGPIGFQYAAEVSFPAPESTSQGLLMLAGQVTGLLFTAGMSVRDNAWLPAFMITFVGLALVGVVMVSMLRESPMILTEAERAQGKTLAGSEPSTAD
jgi:Na+/melibiose symporter-like transporter